MADFDDQTKPEVSDAELHVAPEYAVAERDVREIVSGEVETGTSLWRDAQRRLLSNRLAVFGVCVVVVVSIACLTGPTLIEKATGFTYDFIPREASLTKAFAPFRSAGGSFSWTHPM